MCKIFCDIDFRRLFATLCRFTPFASDFFLILSSMRVGLFLLDLIGRGLISEKNGEAGVS